MKVLVLKMIPFVVRQARWQVAAGILVFAVAVFATLTGQYESLAAREQAETLLNRVALGALLYAIGFWYVDLFLRPRLNAASRREK